MEKVYIVTARDEAEAVRKIKELRKNEIKDKEVCDEPVMYPDEDTLEYFVNLIKHKVNAVKFDDVATKPNDVLAKVKRVVEDLDDETTVGNIWWDMKKVIEHNEDDKLEDVVKSYEDMIAVHEDFAGKLRDAANKIKDDKIKSEFVSWSNWYDDKIEKAKENIKYNLPFAHEKIENKKKRAAEAAAKAKAIAEAKAAKK